MLEWLLVGIGIDIIEIERIRGTMERQGRAFVERLFNEKECAYCDQHDDSAIRYAGHFAAKEAVVKAFGHGIPWKEIEIVHNAEGKPHAEVGGEAVEISISHCKTHATAVALRQS